MEFISIQVGYKTLARGPRIQWKVVILWKWIPRNYMLLQSIKPFICD